MKSGIVLSGIGYRAVIGAALARAHYDQHILPVVLPPSPHAPGDVFYASEREEMRRGSERGRIAQDRRDRRAEKKARDIERMKAGITKARTRLA